MARLVVGGLTWAVHVAKKRRDLRWTSPGCLSGVRVLLMVAVGRFSLVVTSCSLFPDGPSRLIYISVFRLRMVVVSLLWAMRLLTIVLLCYEWSDMTVEATGLRRF